MKTSKKILSFVLAVVMIVTTCSVGFTAFAADGNKSNSTYWNDKADADAAFESINNLVDYFVPTILNIEVGSGEEKTTLGESLGISKSDFDKTKVTDIVKAVSPKLIGPLSTVRKALDSNYSANGKEQIMRDVFGLSSDDTIQPYYDLYLNYLEDDGSSVSFYDLYQMCTDNLDSSDEKLKEYANTTKEALDVLLAAAKSANAKLAGAENLYHSALGKADIYVKTSLEETENNELRGTKLKDLTDSNGYYAVGVEFASNYYKNLGFTEIAKSINNPGAAYYYYYSGQGYSIRTAFAKMSLVKKAGGELTTADLITDYAKDSTVTAKSITADNYKDVLADFSDKYISVNKLDAAVQIANTALWWQRFVDYTNYAAVEDKYATHTVEELQAEYGNTENGIRKLRLAFNNSFNKKKDYTNPADGKTYKFNEFMAQYQTVVNLDYVYAQLVNIAYFDLSDTPDREANDYKSSNFQKILDYLIKDYSDKGYIDLSRVDGEKITDEQLKEAAKVLKANNWIGLQDFCKLVSGDYSNVTSFAFSSTATKFFKTMFGSKNSSTGNYADIGEKTQYLLKFTRALSDADGSIAADTSLTEDQMLDKMVANAKAVKYDYAAAEKWGADDGTLVSYINKTIPNYLITEVFGNMDNNANVPYTSYIYTHITNPYESYLKQKTAGVKYSYNNYPMTPEVATAAANTSLNAVINLALDKNGTIGGVVDAALSQLATTKIDIDSLKDLLTDIWSDLATKPVDTIFKLVPTLVILLDEVIEPMVLNGDGDLYNAGGKGQLWGILNGVLDPLSLDQGNTEVGITTVAFDLNKVLPALLHHFNGDDATARSIVGDYSAYADKGLGADFKADTIKYTGIYVADKAISGAQISDIKVGDGDTQKGVQEIITELASFAMGSVDEYVASHKNDIKYSSDGDVANKGLNNIFVSVPQLLDIFGKKFLTKYGVNSDWTYCYDGKIEKKSVSSAAGEQYVNNSLEEFKALYDKNDPSGVLSKFVEILIGDQANALVDLLNDVFATDTNKLTAPIALVQNVLSALGGLGETSVLTDVLNGLFQLKRSDDTSFTFEKRDKTKFVGLSNESCLFLLSNLIYEKNGKEAGLVPFISDLISGGSTKTTKTTSASKSSVASLLGKSGAPLLATSKRTDYNDLLSKRNEKAAAKIVNKLDDILASLLKNTTLNGFNFAANDSILSGVVSTVSNYIGENNTKEIVNLLDKYLACIVANNASSKDGKVNAKNVYTSANLSNLVTETYALVENILGYVFYENGGKGLLGDKDPNRLIVDAIAGVISPDSVAVRMDSKYSKTAKILESKSYLNWTDIKGTNKDLGYGFSKGDKTEFYNALGESLNGIAAVVGVFLSASYVDSAKSGNYYSEILYPVMNNLAKATGATGVMNPVAFNKASHSQQLVKGIMTPVSNILSQLYKAPASFLLNAVKGLAASLTDSSVKSIVNSAVAPIHNLINGLGTVVENLSPTFAKTVRALNDKIKIELEYDKDIIVSYINKLLGGVTVLAGIKLNPIDWNKLAKASSPAQVLLLIYGYAVDTMLDSKLISTILENTDKQNKNNDNAEAIKIIRMLTKDLSATQVLNIIGDVLDGILSPTEVYWTFSEYSNKLSTKKFSYPTDVTSSQAKQAVDQLDELVKNVFPLLKALGVANIDDLSSLINDNLYTNEMLTTIAKAVYGALESNDTINSVLTEIGLDPSPKGFAKFLTAKGYGQTFSSAAKTLSKAKSWSKVKKINWGFKDGSSKAQTGFINGLAAMVRPINGVLAIFLAADGEYSNSMSAAQKKQIVSLIKQIDLDAKSINIAADSDAGCTLKISVKKGILTAVIDSKMSKDNSTLKVDLVSIVNDALNSFFDGKTNGKLGTNGYENAIIPVLEAFMCKNVKTYKQYLSDYNKAKDNLVIDILKPLLGFVDELAKAPVDTLTKVLPNVAYFIDGNGIAQVVSNLLAPITSEKGVLGALKKNGIDVDKLVKSIAGKDLSSLVSGLLKSSLNVNVKLTIKLTDLKSCNIQDAIIPIVNGVLAKNGIKIKIPEIKWATLASHGTLKTVKSAAKNSEGKYTTRRVTANQGEVLVAVLRYVADTLIKNSTGLKKLITSIEGVKSNKTVVAVVKSVFNQVKSASKDDIVRAIFHFLNGEATDVYYNYTGYKSKSYSFDYDNIDPAFCSQLAKQLDTSVDSVFALLKELGVANISSLNALVNDNLYTDSLITTIATGLYGAIDGVKVGSGRLSAILAQVDIDCTTKGFAALLTNKAYGKQYKAAAKVIGKASNWTKVSKSKLSWGVKDKATFLNALAAILRPLYGVLDTLLTDGSLKLLNSVSVPGSNGYESTIAPLLEALGVTGLKTQAQLKADAAKAYDNLLLDIVTPLINKVEEILAKPIETVADMLPTFALFIANDGLIQCVDNLLTPVSALLKAVKPIVDVNDILKAVGLDLNGLLKKAGVKANVKLDLYNLPKTLKPIVGSDNLVPFINSILGIIKVGGKSLNIKLPAIDWYKLASHGQMKTVKSVAKNTQGKYTRKIVEGRQGETLLAVLRYIESLLINNAKAISNIVCNIDAVKKNKTIANVVKSILNNISNAKFDEIVKALFYFLQGKQTDAFFDYSNFTYKTDYKFSYGSMDKKFCKQLAPMLDGLVTGLLQDKGGLLGLITDMVYSDEIVGKLATALYGAIENVKIDGIGSLNNILKLIGIDFSASNVADLLVNEKYGQTYPQVASVIRSAGSWANVKATSLKWGVKDRKTFLHALVSVLRPIYGVLDVLLNDSNLNIYNIASVPGSDGYTSTIVPLLEAFGVYNIKTQYQYREDMNEAYDAVLLDILNPLMDKVEDILNAPIEMLADILPNLSLFFANDGLLQIIENLLTPVSALLDAVKPIVNVNDLLSAVGFDINALTAKAGINLNIKLDVYDLSGSLKPLIGADNVVGLLNTILSVVKISGKSLGIVLPEIDWFKLASHGDVIINEASQAATIGGRIYVKADQDETLIAVLRFLIDTVNYKDNYDAIVGLVGGLLGGASSSISDVVSQVLDMLKGDSDKVIANLVDLLQSFAG